MTRVITAIGLLLSISGQLSAQEKTLWELDEVVVSDTRLKNYADGHKITVLKDSTIERHGIFLTSLLAFNSNLYFKENGFGMVASPSFRGTNASHTAVIWNGININSPLNGQVDFNTVNPFNYNSVNIRSGGGSVQFGTGAIGGSIHLDNTLEFKDHFDHKVRLGYGDFDTRKVNYAQNFGNGRWSHNFGINYTSSDNDYTYLETDQRNRNGSFQNGTLNFNSGYQLSDNNLLRLYHQSFIGNRNLSGNIVSLGRGRYEDTHYRTQVEWIGLGKQNISRLKLAQLFEGFKYFENKEANTFSDGQVTTLLARYSYDTKLSDAIRLSSNLEYDHYRGDGSNFGNPRRNDVSITGLMKHSVSESLVYNFGLRKDFSSDFSSPLVFSLDGKFKVADHYVLQLNASRNFRMPTFNDLFWEPGGNLQLLPENSYQVDFGQVLELGKTTFKLNGYYIATHDMIRWLPNGSGAWSPSNIDKVRIYGLEGETGLAYSITRNQQIEIKMNYVYTVSQDQATGEQLIYVPFHRGNASIGYNFKQLSLFYQHLHNGPVSIVGGELEGYHLGNTGVRYSPELGGKLQYSIGLSVNNLFNTYYENVALRPMPNRNIQTQLLLNF